MLIFALPYLSVFPKPHELLSRVDPETGRERLSSAENMVGPGAQLNHSSDTVPALREPHRTIIMLLRLISPTHNFLHVLSVWLRATLFSHGKFGSIAHSRRDCAPLTAKPRGRQSLMAHGRHSPRAHDRRATTGALTFSSVEYLRLCCAAPALWFMLHHLGQLRQGEQTSYQLTGPVPQKHVDGLVSSLSPVRLLARDTRSFLSQWCLVRKHLLCWCARCGCSVTRQ